MRLSGLAAALCVAGCAMGPDAPVPRLAAHAADAFVSRSPGADAARDLPDRWWQLYDDPALSALVDEALRANTDLRVALANLAIARAAVQEAQAGRWPTTQVGAGALYGRSLTADSIAAAFHGHAENQTTRLASVDVSYELDLYGRVSRSIDAATADALALEAARDAVRVTVAAETTRAYATARSAGRELQVAQRSVQIADDAVAIVVRQVAAGAASEFDLARVRVLADQARAQVPALEGRRRAAVFELTALLGRIPADAPMAQAYAIDESSPLRLALPVGDGAALLARRPDVRQAERRLAAATARIDVATAALYPRVSLGASVGYASNEVLKGSNAVTLALGPLISWSFPNQAVARSRISQSSAAADAALAAFDGTVLRALKEVEQAISGCEAERVRHDALADAEASAALAFRLSRVRQREGVLSQLDLLTAEQTWLLARAALAASDTRVVDAQITLFKALGGGWQSAQAGVASVR